MALKVKTYNNVQANVTFSKASSRVEINPIAEEAATENIALTLGKISKWYDSLVPTGGSSGKFLGWNSSGTAKWVDAPTAEDKNMSQTLKTDNVNRPLLMSIESTSNTTATVTTTGARNNSMYGNVSTGLIFCRGREISNVTLKTGTTAQSHITLNTLMTWLITSKQYIPSGKYCHVVLSTAWDYANSDILQVSINSTNYEIQLAGVIIEFMGSATSYNAGTFRLLIHSSPTTSFTATTGYTKFPTATTAEYTCNGSSYSPVWKMMLNAHPTITVSADTTSETPLSHGGTFTAITSVTRDSNGHTTKVNTATYTLPSDNNTTYTFATGDAVGQFKVKASTASGYTNYNVNGISAGTASGTANLMAYYSTATKISSTPKMAYHEINSTASTPVKRNILHLFGEGVGNDAPKLISGTVGIIGYGDGGPQINFNTASSDTVTGGQNGAIIFTDHDSAAAGVSWHFVSDQTDWNVISKRFHAKTSISIGTDKPPSTTYTFYVTGSSYYTGDIVIGTSGSSSNDTGDITWKYGNGNEKARIWFDDTYTAKQGPRFRLYKSDGTSLYSGYLPLADGTSASGTWGISITGTAASANKLNTNAGNTSRPVYFSGGIPIICDTPASGAYWTGVPYVGSNGVMEIGKYIDFHGSNTSTNDYDYRITAETQTIYFAPKSSGDATYNLIRMQSPDYNQIQFQTTKTGKAYTSTGIVAYPLTTSGQTMLIQSDGNTVVGGGESPRTLYSNSYDNMDTAENETLYLASDSSEIHFITNCQAYSGRKVLKVQDAQLVKTGGIWIAARDNAPVYANKPNAQDGGYYPAWFAKSKSGGWSMGVLSAQDNLYITYTTDADYSASPQQNQNTYQIQFQNKSGTVALTSDIPTIPTVNNASLTLKGAGTTVTTFTANSSTNQSLDIVAGTNVTITPDATNHKITIASTDIKVTQTAVGSTYTNYRPLVISASNADSTPPTATTVTDGTFITSSIYCQPSSGSVYATKFVGPLDVSRVAKDSKAFPGVNKAIIEEYASGSTYNLPSNHYYHIISIQGPDTKYGTQLALGMTTTGAYYRNYNNQTWSDWKSIINTNTTYTLGTSGNNVTLTPAGGSAQSITVPYATNANNINTTVTNGTTSSVTYGITFAADPNTSESNTLRKNNDFRINLINGTTSAGGLAELVLGNAKNTTTADNKEGLISLYSSNTSYHMLKVASTTSAITHTFPATSGTVLNSGTTSFTQTQTSGTKIGSIKINGTSTDIYAPSSYVPMETVTTDVSANTYFTKTAWVNWNKNAGTSTTNLPTTNWGILLTKALPSVQVWIPDNATGMYFRRKADANTDPTAWWGITGTAGDTYDLSNMSNTGLGFRALTSRTALDTTSGSFIFSVFPIATGDNYDWVGFQADAGHDRFQLIPYGSVLLYRENDDTTPTSAGWSNFHALRSLDGVSGSNGITVDYSTSTIGTGDDKITYTYAAVVKHTNSITAGTAKGDNSKTLTFGGTFKIPSITYDANGHITTWTTTTMTMPSNPNSDTKVNVTLATTSKAYLLGTTTTPTGTAQGVTSVADTGVYLDTTAGMLTATTFKAGNMIEVNNSSGMKVTANTASAWARGIEYYVGSTYASGIGGRGDANTFAYLYMGKYDDNIARFYQSDKSTYFYGTVHLKENLYGVNPVESAMNCHNSNITNVNSIIFNDDAGPGEGLMFYRSTSTWDSVWASGGQIYFTPNYPTDTSNKVVLHSENIEQYGYHDPKFTFSSYTDGPIGPVTRNAINHLRGDRLIFLPGANVSIEYSTNGGSSWADAGYTADQKANMFIGRNVSSAVKIGPNNTTARTTSMMTRITITCDGRDTKLDQFYFRLDSGYHKISVEIQASRANDENTFTTISGPTTVGTWTYQYVANVPLQNKYTSGGTTTTVTQRFSNSHMKKYRFIFRYVTIGSPNTELSAIAHISAYSGSYWGQVGNNMAYLDHLYTWDRDQNATFPANVTSAKFIGPLQGNADTATSASELYTHYDAGTYGNTYALWWGNTTDSADTTSNYARRNGNATIKFRSDSNGWAEIYLGNALETGTAGSSVGWLGLYSPGTGCHNLSGLATNTELYHYFPSVGGTLLNSGNYSDYAVPYLGNLRDIGSGTPAAATKTYFDSSSVPTLRISGAYNNNGAEYGLIFAKGGSNSYGSVLRWGYGNTYIQILRKGSGTWQSTDWEKISAGYADKAGSITTESGSSAGARPVFYAYLGDTSRVVYNTSFTYNPSGGVLQTEQLALKSGSYTTTIQKGTTTANRTLLLPNASGALGISNILYNAPTNSSTTGITVSAMLSDYDYFTIIIGQVGSNAQKTTSTVVPAVAGLHYFVINTLEALGSGGGMIYPAGVNINQNTSNITFTLGINRGIIIPSSGSSVSVASATSAYIKMIIGHKS